MALDTTDSVPEASKLPVEHPDFIYPSSKNPYAKRFHDFAQTAYTDGDTESRQGTWLTSQFSSSPRKGPLHVEVGCNAGHVILEWARRNPEASFIGLDWKMKAVARAADKARKAGTDNLLFLRAHAHRLKYIFAPEEIDHFYLFFPDPWPKKSDAKHRFVTEINLREIHRLLKPGATLWIKTDHDAYFEWMLEEFKKVPGLFDTEELSRDLHAGNPNADLLQIPEVTLFEKLFIKDGIKIKSLRVRKALNSELARPHVIPISAVSD